MKDILDIKNELMDKFINLLGGKGQRYYKILELQDEHGIFKTDEIPRDIVNLLDSYELAAYVEYIEYRNKCHVKTVSNYFKAKTVPIIEVRHDDPYKNFFVVGEYYNVSMFGEPAIQQSLRSITVEYDKGQYWYGLGFDRVYAWFDEKLYSEDGMIRIL